MWSRTSGRQVSGEVEREFEPKNPWNCAPPWASPSLFVTMLVATHLVVTYLGKAGVYSLAALMGVTDVDPFRLRARAARHRSLIERQHNGASIGARLTI